MIDRDQFVNFLAREWNGTRKWFVPRPPVGRSAERRDLTFQGLSDAKARYDWNGMSFAENKVVLNELSSSLQRAIKAGDDAAAARCCIDIGRWGGVMRHRADRTRLWVDSNARQKSLCRKISASVDLLSDPSAPLDRFDGNDLLMNSAATKIVSLADRDAKLIIFDGRVGAALGALVRTLCLESGACELHGDLQFPWGESQTALKIDKKDPRCPDDAALGLRFPSLFRSRFKDRLHSETMRIASQIVDASADTAGVEPRDFEAALFTLGYDVRSQRYLTIVIEELPLGVAARSGVQRIGDLGAIYEEDASRALAQMTREFVAAMRLRVSDRPIGLMIGGRILSLPPAGDLLDLYDLFSGGNLSFICRAGEVRFLCEDDGDHHWDYNLVKAATHYEGRFRVTGPGEPKSGARTEEYHMPLPDIR